MAIELRSYVGGNWHTGTRLVDDINPADPSEAVAHVSMGNSSVAVAAVEAASAAFADWRRTPAPARGDILRKAADLLEQRADAVGRDLTREEGKTLVEGIGETKRAAAILRYYASLTLAADGQTYPSLSAKTFLFARREPIGVVTAITPWNFPIAIPAWKIAPALAYGVFDTVRDCQRAKNVNIRTLPLRSLALGSLPCCSLASRPLRYLLTPPHKHGQRYVGQVSVKKQPGFSAREWQHVLLTNSASSEQ